MCDFADDIADAPRGDGFAVMPQPVTARIAASSSIIAGLEF
jgi:hypothetical protein